jgi:hypothetical protein
VSTEVFSRIASLFQIRNPKITFLSEASDGTIGMAWFAELICCPDKIMP